MNPAPPVTRERIERGMLAAPEAASTAVTVASMAGLFVTIEGIDRSGKTTQARLLCDALGDSAFAVREPGGTAVGERIRDVLKDPGVEMGPATEALLFAAARAELVASVVRPALERGLVVVSDRFLDSSLAYQGGARSVGVDEVARVNRFATGGLVPDLTFFLDIDPREAARRAGSADRFEREGLELQERVSDAYARLAEAEPQRWRPIDAEWPVEDVHAEILEAVRVALAATGTPA